jgi:transmembrane sensor
VKDSIDDFLKDPGFIKWVKDPGKESILYWEKWQKANPDKINALQEAREILLSINYEKPAPDDSRYHRILDNIIDKSPPVEIYRETKRNNWNPVRWVAASLILIMSYILIFEFQGTKQMTEETIEIALVTKSNPAGRKSKILLPDSSVVHLNSMSSITYSSNFLNDRVIELTGEAFFTVRHQKLLPFRVISGDIVTTVLGTSFNINAFPDDPIINVSLKEGKVRIDSDIGESLLVPGKSFVYNKSTKDINTGNFDPEDELGWIDGLLVLMENDVQSFITKIERWYGVEVEVVGNPQSKWQINGKFKNLSLELLMENISFAKGISYKIDGNKLKLFF